MKLEKFIDPIPQRLVFRPAEGGIFGKYGLCLLLCLLQNTHIRREVGYVHLGKAVLTGAEEITGPPQPKILLRDNKTVVRLGHDLKP